MGRVEEKKKAAQGVAGIGGRSACSDLGTDGGGRAAGGGGLGLSGIYERFFPYASKVRFPFELMFLKIIHAVCGRCSWDNLSSPLSKYLTRMKTLLL